MTSHRFIVFEGVDGSGKSTQVRLLDEYLRDRNLDVVATCEPSRTELGVSIRKMIMSESLPELTTAFLFSADRAQHVEMIIRPALEKGITVISDRYVDSFIAYQGVSGNLKMQDLRLLSRIATKGLKPDLTIILDIDPAISLERIQRRGTMDRIESSPIEFHRDIRGFFLKQAEFYRDRYVVIDGTGTPEEIHQRIRDVI